MLSKELLQKIKQIEVKSKHLASEVFAGEYTSAFRGQGMAFEEVREYQPGDEIRSIDWNVTARMGHPYVKVYREEREISVLFVIDASASEDFGSRVRPKKETVAEVAALLAYAATRSHDKIGLLIFTDQVEKYIPPKKGSTHVWQVIREILTFKPSAKKTDLICALEFLVKVLPRKSVCFLFSDFIAPPFEKALSLAATRHDLVAFAFSDPLEKIFPDLGWVLFEDPETGQSEWIPTHSPAFQNTFRENSDARGATLFKLFRKLGMDACAIQTDQDYVHPLLQLFRARERRQH